jgi:hypothetical protein
MGLISAPARYRKRAGEDAVSEPTGYLLVMTPRLHHLIEVLHAGDRDDFAQVFEEHDSELLT